MNDEVKPPANAVGPAKPKTFGELITGESYKAQLQAALPKGLTADRMVRVVLTAFNRTPKLLECTKESLWQSVLDCASLGLFPDALGRAYLVPFKGKCQLIIGYRGLIDLAYRSDRIGMIQIAAVYAGDVFTFSKGLNPDLKHDPCTKPGELTHVYSIVHIKGCEMPSFEVMRRDEVEAIRRRSKAGDNGPWVTDFAAMAMKTVFRRHAKVLPMSAELAQAIETDGDALDLDLAAVAASKPARFTDDAVPTHDTTAETTVEIPVAP